MCHTAVGLTPVLEGRVRHLSAGGLFNGLVLLVDDETGSYWDHVTGEALHGPLKGHRLSTWPVKITRAAAAIRAQPDLQLLESRRRLLGGWLDGLIRWQIGSRGLLPFFFHRTMGRKDRRLSMMEHGLGVIVEGEGRFYPAADLKHGLTDVWKGRRLHLGLGSVDRFPEAVWEDGTRPMQIFSCWYGFSFAYPGCLIRTRRSAAETRD
ncbi:MAG: DUF3179 domain-containing (seleno)protein [Acidobacteriota bacterium]